MYMIGCIPEALTDLMGMPQQFAISILESWEMHDLPMIPMATSYNQLVESHVLSTLLW